MANFYFIRHAQSTFNVGLCRPDDRNVRLTDTGKEQSKSLKLMLNLLIISPLIRAIETLANSNIGYDRIEINELFQEHRCRCENLTNFDSRDFETEQEWNERIDNAIKYLRTIDSGVTSVGILCHHDFIYHLTRRLTGKPVSLHNANYHYMYRDEIHNDSISQLEQIPTSLTMFSSNHQISLNPADFDIRAEVQGDNIRSSCSSNYVIEVVSDEE